MTLSFSSYGLSNDGLDIQIFYRKLSDIRAIPWDDYSNDELYAFFEQGRELRLDAPLLKNFFPFQRIADRYTIDQYFTFHAGCYEFLTPEQLQQLTNPLHAKRFIDYRLQQHANRSGILRMETDWATFYPEWQQYLQHIPIPQEQIGNYIIARIREMRGTVDIALIPHTNEIHMLGSEAFLRPLHDFTEIPLSL